jgi:CubicO group peptidase (beta-lactamase class C family)
MSAGQTGSLLALLTLAALSGPLCPAATPMPAIVAPESVGLSSERLERVDRFVAQMIKRGERAGASLVIMRRGKTVLARAYGAADLERARPMTVNTLVRLYSMSRALTSVGVMSLYEEGRLQLTDPIGRYLPELASPEVLERDAAGGWRRVPARRPITITHLLTHTSGLSYNYPPVAGYQRDVLIGQDHTLADMVPRLASLPLLHHPGEGWTYGLSTDVLARLIEVVSRQTIDVFLAQRVFEPLRMQDTFFRVPAGRAAELAEVYALAADGKLQRATDRAPRSGPFAGEGRFLSGGGGLVSSALDYARFCQMLVGGGALAGRRVLSSETVRYMMRSHVPLEFMPPRFAGPGGDELFSGYGFGLGFAVLLDPQRHGVAGPPGIIRWGGLAGTTFWADAERELVVVFMSQQLQSGASRIERDLQALVYGAVTDWPLQ